MDGVFFPGELRRKVLENVARHPPAGRLRGEALERARPWLSLSDEELWSLMFGPTITRSWMVWSDGHCPACGKPVPMYNWKMDAMARPWKTWCPHCGEAFPGNDFAAFYRSGLDARGVFSPARADRALLFNEKHPDPGDPRHLFGVDDGEGYVEGGKRWRFIGAYLVYGQWKQAVLGGIRALAEAHLLSGDGTCARKAALLLDRVADLYPGFDFATQGYNYEKQGTDGYLGNWHDACEETRELALAWDMVRAGAGREAALVPFLARKARECGLENRKASFADVRRNIETGILRDALANPHKIHSNYPRREIAEIVIMAVLGQPREDIFRVLDRMLRRATAVDGVTGEKGLANYSASVIQSLASFLALLDRAEEGFLRRCLEVHPRLRLTWRFHIDTWCLGRYYPLVGDTGWFAMSIDQYCGVRFRHPAAGGGGGFHGRRPASEAPLEPSMYTFLWKLYRLTGDAAYAQVLHHANGHTVEGLPHDLFAAEEEGRAVREGVARAVAGHGPAPAAGCVNKERWGLAILRSGEGANARAAWLNYAVGGNHHHQDGLNLGLFAHGLDLMPDFGYPPVQYGGWQSPRARWYKMSAAHNTVVVDGADHACAPGRTTLRAEGRVLRAVRASAPEMVSALAVIPDRVPIADPWKFMWDPRKKGEELGWPAGGFDDSGWLDIGTDSAWQAQPPGRAWKAEHGRDYSGVAWYRTRIGSPPPGGTRKVFLVFGAVDAACVVWVNGQRVLDRPYPCRGDISSWEKPFRVEVTGLLRPGGGNTVAVRVEKEGGHGGIWKGAWLARADMDRLPAARRFERTVALVDMPDPERFYLLDIFRVSGGRDHARFMHGPFAELRTAGPALVPGEEYGRGTLMRDFRRDSAPPPGWRAEWLVRGPAGPPEGKGDIRLRYTDLTPGARAETAEGWVSRGGYGDSISSEAWIPRLVTRRLGARGVLDSTFVGVIEPCEGASGIRRIRRLPAAAANGRACPESDVVVEVTHADGWRDLVMAADPAPDGARKTGRGKGRVLIQREWRVRLEGEFCLVRLAPDGAVRHVAAVNASAVVVSGRRLRNRRPGRMLEWSGGAAPGKGETGLHR